MIRGLTHSGVPVAVGTKIIEVDPRGDPAAVFGLGERPRRIAEGVCRAIAIIYPPVLRSSVSGSQGSDDNTWAAASWQLNALIVSGIGAGP